MYCYNPNFQSTTADSFSNVLDMKYLQEMCLGGTCSSLSVGSAMSSSGSPAASSPASESESFLYNPLFISPIPSNKQIANGSDIGITMENLRALQQQQLFAANQQHLSNGVVSQHDFSKATILNQQYSPIHNSNILESSAKHQQNEICKSLKMFAMLTSYSDEAESCAFNAQLPQSPVDDVMQDFASNGHTCDEINRFRLDMDTGFTKAANNNDNTAYPSNFSNDRHIISNGPNYTHTHKDQNNMDFTNNFWKMFPIYFTQYSNAAAAAAAAAVNIDYNSNKKRMPKRYNVKNPSVKHCVFCENNNAPEDVVKSHAVRDSLGRVLCPKLRTYTCPICKASGDNAHTVKYCPRKPIITMEDAMKAESSRFPKNTSYKHQMNV